MTLYDNSNINKQKKNSNTAVYCQSFGILLYSMEGRRKGMIDYKNTTVAAVATLGAEKTVHSNINIIIENTLNIYISTQNGKTYVIMIADEKKIVCFKVPTNPAKQQLCENVIN